MFTLRPATKFYKQPNYKMRNMLSIQDQVTMVEGPPLDEVGGFCLYNLFDENYNQISPKTAWTPCYNIKGLVIE